MPCPTFLGGGDCALCMPYARGTGNVGFCVCVCDGTLLRSQNSSCRATQMFFLTGLYFKFDLYLQTPNWGQIHQDFWWVNQPFLWLQGLVHQVN